jgi:hypothetical protein
MAITERYLNTDLATGGNDGTSEADAWQSIAAAASGLTAGQRLNWKRTASRLDASASVTFSQAAGLTTPVHIRAYDTTPGDGGYVELENLSLTFSGRDVLAEGLDILNANGVSGFPINFTSFGGHAHNCKVVRTGSSYCRGIRGQNSINVTNCYLQYAASGAVGEAMIDATNGSVVGNIVEMDGGCGDAVAAIRLTAPSEHGTMAAFNICRGLLGRPTQAEQIGIWMVGMGGTNEQGFVVTNNTVLNFGVGLLCDAPTWTTDGIVLVSNNLFFNCPQSVWANRGSGYTLPGKMVKCVNNAYDGGIGGSVLKIGNRRITQDPFTDLENEDYSLNEVSGGGLVCRASAKSVSSSTLDIGAVQS